MQGWQLLVQELLAHWGLHLALHPANSRGLPGIRQGSVNGRNKSQRARFPAPGSIVPGPFPPPVLTRTLFSGSLKDKSKKSVLVFASYRPRGLGNGVGQWLLEAEQ